MINEDYFLNGGETVTIPLKDENGDKTCSGHRLNREAEEVRIQELVDSLLKHGHCDHLTGCPIAVRDSSKPNRWHTLTHNHRTKALYRAEEHEPANEKIRSSFDMGS